MIGIWHYLLAFFVASIFTLTELLSNEYAMTFSFLRRSKSLYAYGAAYGFCSIAFLWCLQYFGLYSCLITTLLGNSWAQAIVIGLITKALLHVSIFRADSIPIGLETFSHIFEPRLLKQIALDEYNVRQRYISAAQVRYPNLDVVLDLIVQNIPDLDHIADVFLEDLNYKLFVEFSEEPDHVKIKFAMDSYLVEFGKQTFERTFP
jgi:hypothetical protein